MSEGENYTLDDIQSDIAHLGHLIGETVWKLTELDRTGLQEPDKHQLNRASAFAWVSRDLIERIESGFEEARISERVAAKGERQ